MALDFNARITGGPQTVEMVEGDNPELMISRRRREAVSAGDITVHSGNMDLTDVSKEGRIWTFTPNHDSLDVSNWDKNTKIFLITYFDNMNSADISKAKKAALLFFRYPMPDDSASCLVDRFDDYPL